MTTVTFRIGYKTEYGQNLYIIGSTEELGSWKTFNHLMKWSEGHVWTIDLKLEEKRFEYKHVVRSATDTIWEPGENRVCVLDILPLPIVLDSVWNSYKVQFAVYFPLKNADEDVCIIGDIEELGRWSTFPPACHMTLGKPRKIANTGQEGPCWEVELTLPNTLKEFGYKYVVYNKSTKELTMEREVGRYFKIIKDSYEHYLKSKEDTTAYEYNKPEVLVNGRIVRFDTNLALEGLLFDEVLESRLYVGPYPQKRSDVKCLKDKAGIEAVLNLQTERDFKHRRINVKETQSWIEGEGMRFVHFSINDFDPLDLADKLLKAAGILKDLVEKYKKVYVHCTAGMGRAASVAVMYMVLYEKMKPEEARNYIKSKRKAATPNMGAIETALSMVK
eukprot:TRINITY_DN3522_c0_g1_i8.p1 TRINITY_DN3522_c0_g1~~TRINITY_DN3522_c0_g1_i8.p1  ORF type:complete len:389 (-),score=72.69 TRINITY_DN3522_c0_g1_i8:123-1289(-)